MDLKFLALGQLGRFWILCLIINTSGALHKGSRGLEGESSSSSQTQMWPTHNYWPCPMPLSPNKGQASCSISNDKYACTGTCLPGYYFPDGSNTKEIECSRETGQFEPYATFEECSGGEPQVSSSRYTGFSSFNNWPCQRPMSPNNGQVFCIESNYLYACTGTCLPGYFFPDGSNTIEIKCSREKGEFEPYATFEECSGVSGSGGEEGYGHVSFETSSDSHNSAYGQNVYSQGLHGGDATGRRVQYSYESDDEGLCGEPRVPNKGSYYCSNSKGQWSCHGRCKRGYKFPDGTRKAVLTCNERDGRWSPKKDFDDCIQYGARTSDHGNYNGYGYEQGGVGQQSQSSFSQQTTARRLHHGGYEEFQQQRMGHEFGGLQQLDPEFDLQQQMGHEFGEFDDQLQ